MNRREQTIKTVFGGNEGRFEEAYEAAAQEAIQQAVSWKDIDLSAKVLPDLETQTKDLIEGYLGYLPHPSAGLRYEPYLRALLLRHQQGGLSEEEFRLQAEEHIKLIRNADVAPYRDPIYSPSQYDHYRETFVPYGQRVKDRLARFLGYEPQLEHSLVIELWLRNMLSMDTIQWPNCLTVVDYKALTIIRYREILLTQGQAAADASPFFKQFS
ncbi:hypothetical protein [Runella aurantiaca]|uniref:Uncharacterized protein n=1 Tax=Runella aurantiaca TaxID=2282308 RepID=A0A369IKS8_9BACT|nr:hypothetical protein [Runella aurantiaca]RDB07844.1 hypothetical protein DVG78_01975 [Runella aurantiaca]